MSDENKPKMTGIQLGLVIGAGLGIVAGLLLGNIALGIAIGAGIGLVFGILWGKRNTQK